MSALDKKAYKNTYTNLEIYNKIVDLLTSVKNYNVTNKYDEWTLEFTISLFNRVNTTFDRNWLEAIIEVIEIKDDIVYNKKKNILILLKSCRCYFSIEKKDTNSSIIEKDVMFGDTDETMEETIEWITKLLTSISSDY